MQSQYILANKATYFVVYSGCSQFLSTFQQFHYKNGYHPIFKTQTGSSHLLNLCQNRNIAIEKVHSQTRG